MADTKLRSRQESTDSLDSTQTGEDYSDEDKDGLDVDDFHIIKTIGTFFILTLFIKVHGYFCSKGY